MQPSRTPPSSNKTDAPGELAQSPAPQAPLAASVTNNESKFTIPQPSNPDGPRLTMYSYEPEWPREESWQRIVGPVAASRQVGRGIHRRSLELHSHLSCLTGRRENCQGGVSLARGGSRQADTILHQPQDGPRLFRAKVVSRRRCLAGIVRQLG